MGHKLHPYLEDMRSALDVLEAELRALNWWQSVSEQPSAVAMASVEPFCVDSMEFSQWLQWIYIPKMHAYMNQHGNLPAASGLLPIAEEAWKYSETDTRRAQQVMRLLDDLVAGEPHQELLRELLAQVKQ